MRVRLREASLLLLLAQGCGDDPASLKRDPEKHVHAQDDSLRINHLQVKATHNSYHIAPSAMTIPDWSYTHAPLDVQFGEQGVRGVELDLHWDATLGVYRVYHVPLLDAVSTCDAFTECLETMRRWSDENPGHHPIFVQLEPKPGIGAELLDAIDAEIRSVFPPELLITPDEVRGGSASLKEALEERGWPTLGQARGRFLFSFDCSRELSLAYAGREGRLEGRVMFPDSNPEDPFAGFMVVNSPGARARQMVEEGYLVRVFAENLARLITEGDRPEDGADRLAAALESGAHVISTDVPVPREDLAYVTEIPGGTPSRCNPVSAPEGCLSTHLEDPALLERR